MRTSNNIKIFILMIVAVLAVSITGCGKQHDITEEPEITVEYLSGEYADQLIRDGGEIITGTIDIEETGDGIYSVTVNSMLIVESDSEDEGYYIADKNLSESYPMDTDARITYIGDQGNDPAVVSVDEFIEKTSVDESDPLEEGNEELYDVYTIGGNAFLILAKDMPDSE